MNTTTYLRKAMASQISQRVDFKEEFYLTVSIDSLASGYVPSLFDKIMANQTQNAKQQKTDEASEEISVLLALKTLKTAIEDGMRASRITDLSCVYFAPAVLRRDGHLSHQESKTPWFVREYLAPMVEADLCVGKADDVDTFLSDHISDWHRIKNWSDYWRYICDMYQFVTGAEIKDLSVSETSRIHFEPECYVFIDKTVFAAQNILKLYDEILHRWNQEPLQLYRKLVSQTPTQTKPLIAESLSTMKAHSGQMGCIFSLSESQRMSLNHLNSMGDGEILAVSGPPGTGKTTLLQSVVADLVVKRALSEKEAPIIVAASTNNQAVTNIIDSFSDMKAVDPSGLDRRWVTVAQSLATYFPSASKKARAERKYQTDENMLNEINCKEALASSRSKMLEECCLFFGLQLENIYDCKLQLHEALTQNEAIRCRLLKNHSATMKLTNEIPPHEYFEANAISIAQLQQETSQVERMKQQMLRQRHGLAERMAEWQTAYKKQNSWLNRTFSNIPAIREKLIRWALTFKSEEEIAKCPTTKTVREILAFYDKQILQADHEISSLSDKLESLSVRIDKLEKSSKEVEESLKATIAIYDEIKGQKACPPPKDSSFDQFVSTATLYALNSYLDVSIRWRSFWLAVHYFECRWLEEEPITQTELWKSTYSMLTRKYCQLSKLTPCFVMTFYMLPSKFKTYNDTFLMEYIDLLIVDEAGQTSPEIAAASFALAKKAIVVGDEYQIPPVWGVSRSLDIALAIESGVIQSEQEFDTLEKSGLNTSQSSVMKLAKRACPYKAFEGGLFLSEHRRCYDEIIGYCNDLVYQNRLKPLRGSGEKRPELMKKYPIIGYHNIPVSLSEKVGTSRKNQKEAMGIAQWVSEHFYEFREVYPNQDEDAILAVITPFKAQALEIEVQLRKSFLPGPSPVKVGTVHTFQGAEKKIIVFSTTYGEKESGYFIEKNSNLMNVAVSRAKDAFWVFGSVNCLQSGDATSAKGLLYHYIQNHSF